MSWVESFLAEARANLDEKVRDELAARGVDDDQIDQFQIGCLRDELPIVSNLRFERWAERHAERLLRSYVLPLTNSLGDLRGFQFRAVDRSRKGYIDFFLDEGNVEPVLFGLGQAMPAIWKSGGVWLVEGGFDLFAVQRVRPNVVSTLTAKANDSLVRLLQRITDRVYLGYDNDETGRLGVKDFLRDHGNKFEVRTMVYPKTVVRVDGVPVKDPSDLWEAIGDDGIGELFRCIETKEPHEGTLYGTKLSFGGVCS